MHIRSLIAAFGLCCALGVHAQAAGPVGGSTVSLSFANELGEGKFRTALARSLGEQLAAGRTAHASVDREWAAVLTVRSLSQQAVGGGPATVEAVVSASLVDTETGRVRFTRVVRSTYPAGAANALDRLGELAGRRLGRALCDVACGAAPRPAITPPRRIIKESDW